MVNSTSSKLQALTTPILAVSWGFYPIIIIVLILRLYACAHHSGLALDDWTMLLAWLFYTALVSLNTVSIRRGILQNDEPPVTLADQNSAIGTMYWSRALAYFSVTFGRIAVGVFLARLMKVWHQKRAKYLVYVHVALIAVIAIPTIVMLLVQCEPPSPSQKSDTTTINCPYFQVEKLLAIVQAVFGPHTDLVFIILAFTITFKPHISIRSKIAICCLLSLGLLAGTCGILNAFWLIRSYYSFSWADYLYTQYGFLIWQTLEIELIIIVGSIASSQPLIRRVMNNLFIRTAPAGRFVELPEERSRSTVFPPQADSRPVLEMSEHQSLRETKKPPQQADSRALFELPE